MEVFGITRKLELLEKDMIQDFHLIERLQFRSKIRPRLHIELMNCSLQGLQPQIWILVGI